jgi:hypothetical protein
VPSSTAAAVMAFKTLIGRCLMVVISESEVH